MAYNGVETTLAVEFLRAPLNPYPISHQEICINDLRIKYRSYFVEYNVHDGAIMLPRMLSDGFGSDICRIGRLCDTNQNQFEVLVEKISGKVYFTRGWAAIRDFYDIRVGAWLALTYLGAGIFTLILQDRFHEFITPPLFLPPIKFSIHKSDVPTHFADGLPESTAILSYSHNETFFSVNHEKMLTCQDVCGGFLILPFEEFGEHAFDEAATSIKVVDECGNLWNCSLLFVTTPSKHYKIGGVWNTMVAARRLSVGDIVRVGVQGGENCQTLYLMLGP